MYYESKNYQAHHGIKDQKWHNRRFQNYDGSLTPEGRIRYGVGSPREKKKEESNANSRLKETVRKQRSKKEAIKKLLQEINNTKENEKKKELYKDILKIDNTDRNNVLQYLLLVKQMRKLSDKKENIVIEIMPYIHHFPPKQFCPFVFFLYFCTQFFGTHFKTFNFNVE